MITKHAAQEWVISTNEDGTPSVVKFKIIANDEDKALEMIFTFGISQNSPWMLSPDLALELAQALTEAAGVIGKPIEVKQPSSSQPEKLIETDPTVKIP